MKRTDIPCLLLAALLLPLSGAHAAEANEADLTAMAAERLTALGYALESAAALDTPRINEILADDAFDEPVALDSLFTAEAEYAPLPETAHALTENAIAVAAEPLDWSSASERLIYGASYALTDMRTGAIVRLRCIEITDEYAGFSPLSVWDAANLGGIFDGAYDFRTETCALTIGETDYLAAARITPADLDAESREPAVCRLYFDGSAPRLGDIEGVGRD